MLFSRGGWVAVNQSICLSMREVLVNDSDSIWDRFCFVLYNIV